MFLGEESRQVAVLCIPTSTAPSVFIPCGAAAGKEQSLPARGVQISSAPSLPRRCARLRGRGGFLQRSPSVLGSAPRWGWSWGQGMIWEPLAWCWSPWAAAELGSVPNASGVPDAGGVPKLSALGGGARAPCSHPELTDAGCIGWATLTPTFLQKCLCGSAQNTADCFF